MGLDIYHEKITETPKVLASEAEELPSFIYSCELPPIAFSKLGFDRFVKKELVADFLEKAAIFLNEEDLAVAKPYLLDSNIPVEDFQHFVVGPLADCEGELLDFEIENSLEPDTRCIWDATIELGDKRINFQSVPHSCIKKMAEL